MADSPLYCEHLLTPDGWIDDALVLLDRHGIIEDVSSNSPAHGAITLSGHVIPGMPNLHSHSFQRLMAGMTYRHSVSADSFWTWREEMYRLAQRIEPRQFEAVAAWLQLEMLRAGYTSCAEFHYLHHQVGGAEYQDIAEMSARLMAAADASGIAMTLLPVIYNRGGFAGEPLSDRQKRFGNSVESFLRLFDRCAELVSERPRLRLGLAPHSLRAVSRQILDETLEAAGNRVEVVHIHVAEQPAEVDACLQILGSRPLSWLLDHQDVDQRWCLVHATHTDQQELKRAAATGAVAGLCPSTEADLGDGFFRLEDWLNEGGAFGIGSDSNLRVNVCEELRLLENGARLLSGRRNIMARNQKSCGRFAYEQAAIGGARSVAQPVGRIEAGCRADMVQLDADHPLLVGKRDDQVLDSFVFAGGPSMIRSVWVGGVRLIDGGRHERHQALFQGFRKAVEGLQSS